MNRVSLSIVILCLFAMPILVTARPEQSDVTRQDSTKATPAAESKLSVDNLGLTVRYPEGWTPRAERFSNAKELLYVPRPSEGTAADREARSALSTFPARIMILNEDRLNHADAVKRLKEIEAEESAIATFLIIDGWPALQRRHVAPRPRPGKRAKHPYTGEFVLRMTTAIAAGDTLIRLETALPPEAEEYLASQIETIGRNLVFAESGNPEESKNEIERLRQPSLRSSLISLSSSGPQKAGATALIQPKLIIANTKQVKAASSSHIQNHAATPESAERKSGIPDSESISPDLEADSEEMLENPNEIGLPQRVLNSGSEIETTVSGNGQNIVIATNGGYSSSTNGGVTFNFVGYPPFPAGHCNRNGDPSTAVGQSGNFYYALIGYPTGTNCGTSTQVLTSNATTMYVSTNNGQTFAYRSNAVLCPGNVLPTNPGDCFADQEHIAADRVNAAAGGDQIYSTWRNFDLTDQDPGLVCSQDSAQNWTAPIVVDTGFVPRINVGQDGFVYVIYRTGNNIMVRKYNSCAAGLTPVAGWPRMIASVSDVCTEDLPGIDRCDGRNVLSSHMIAVDDTNANHVYAAYSTHTAAGNENVLVRDSQDGGFTWNGGDVVNLNAGVAGRRFMPWICTVGGTAHVTWFDRRNITAANNDLTDFYRGSAFRSGGVLTAGAETRITDTSDPHCQTGFPCSSDDSNDAESCSVQPQIWGICKLNPVPNPDTSSNLPCDVNQTVCPVNETCTSFGTGCPKYGDYNGGACAAGRIYAVWAASTSPSNVTPPTPSNRIDTFVDTTVVCCIPVISVAASITLPSACAGTTSSSQLQVCNTGFTNLQITGIASSNSQFVAAATFPINIAAGSCSDIQINFTPLTRGLKLSTLTINNNDPVNPARTVLASGTGKGLISITCPVDVTQGNDPGLCSALVNPGTPAINIDADCEATVDADRSDGLLLTDPFPVGTTSIQWTVSDKFAPANTQTCTQTIVVNDIEPPVINNVLPVPAVLWPPNHKMRAVSINYDVTDNCDALALITCSLTVTSDEPVDGNGDGNTSPDWVVLGPHNVLLRSERSGQGDGRVYTIGISCKDSKNNQTDTSPTVTVPHNQ